METAGGGKQGGGEGKKKKKDKKGGGDGGAAAPKKVVAVLCLIFLRAVNDLDNGILQDNAREKEVKAAIKEGGKKAQDIAGMHDMGGMSFFALTMDNCKGDWELLQHAMDGANKEVDESGDDRKGGAGGLAKCLLSTDDSKHLAMYFHVPKELHAQLTLKEWVDAMVVGIGGKALEMSDEYCKYEAPQVRVTCDFGAEPLF